MKSTSPATPTTPIQSGDTIQPEANNYRDLVKRIQRDEDSAKGELFAIFNKGIQFFIVRQLGCRDLDDKVHEIFRILLRAIQRGDLREPERLIESVRVVTQQQILLSINPAVDSRRTELHSEVDECVADSQKNPEQAFEFKQRVKMMKRVLRDLSKKDCGILTRFYLREQTEQEICDEMGLSHTQFRLLKSRANTRFGELGKKEIGRTRLSLALAQCKQKFIRHGRAA